MDLQIYRLLLDFGLVVLIWIVQLVIYPGFNYYPHEQLVQWHQKYTLRISYVVFPLMLGQLIISGFQLYTTYSWYTISSFLMVFILWASTFLQFVPLHNSIGTDHFNKNTTAKLVKKNWLRTFLWSLLFILSIIKTLE